MTTTTSIDPAAPPPTLAARRGCGGPTWHHEQQLFHAWRTGDIRAGHELLERLGGHLRRFFRVRSGPLAEDMVQETLLACVRARATLVDEAALKGYVYAAARRILARELEDEVYLHVHLDDELDLDDQLDLDEDFDRCAVVEHLRHRLQARPTLCTRAAELYYLEGRRGPEIAARLGIAEGTVRSRIRRGLLQLRRGLAAPAAVRS